MGRPAGENGYGKWAVSRVPDTGGPTEKKLDDE